MDETQSAAWKRLFLQALSIIHQAQSSLGFDVTWSFGGGTALMLQIDHRDSFDIDIFIDDPQILPFLNARTQGYDLEIRPDDYQTDGAKALKLVFAGLGEVDFICAAELTAAPTVSRPLLGHLVRLETPAEIIAKKIFYRGSSLQPRDMFDMACAAQTCGERYLIDALYPLSTKAAGALAVSRAMDPLFARSVMQQLRFRPGFSRMPDDSQAIAIKLLATVCGES